MLLTEKVKRIVGPFGDSINCARDIRSGERIFRLSGQVVAQPSKYTIQRWESEHVSPDGALWASVNHACIPNCTIDFETWELVSCSPIRVGEEVTFNYNSTEWEISSPFNCACGSPNCGQAHSRLSLPGLCSTWRPPRAPFAVFEVSLFYDGPAIPCCIPTLNFVTSTRPSAMAS